MSQVSTTYPRLWQHKKTRKKFRVMPWWETITDDGNGIAKVDDLGKMITEVAGRSCKFGVIYQIGFLLENEHGVWFGFSTDVSKEFKDLGEWKKNGKRI